MKHLLSILIFLSFVSVANTTESSESLDNFSLNTMIKRGYEIIDVSEAKDGLYKIYTLVSGPETPEKEIVICRVNIKTSILVTDCFLP